MGQIKNIRARAFLPTLIAHVPEEELFSPETTFVFPTRRAGLFFRYYLGQKRPQTKLLPRIISIADLVNELATSLDSRPLLPRADQAWILWELVRKRPPFAEVSQSFDRFFPWGLRLAEVLDQLDRELVQATNLVYPPEEELPQEARLFLEHLGEIQQAFHERLQELGLITSGLRLRLLAENITQIPFPQGPLHLAGFFMFTRAELTIFKHWLDGGAVLWWREDRRGLSEIFARHERFFGLRAEPVGEPPQRPKVHFYEAPDVHHEVKALVKHLPQEISAPDETLILLCAAGHLIPLLYELPEEMPVNVTLGYPLFRTPLANLFVLFMDLVEGRQESEVYVPAYLRLIKHPYLRGLKAGDQTAGVIFRLLEERLRDHGSPYLPLETIEGLGPERDFLLRFHRELVRPWLEVETSFDLARVLRRTVSRVLAPRLEKLLHEETPETLLERAFLFAFESEVLPSLERVSFARVRLKPRTLFSFLRDLLRHIRVPFEGEPLEGLQVMGLLETRLLSFRQVLVLDANEGYLPSVEEVNPILPEGVKPLLGLPPREREEIIERYHFFNLVDGAEEVHLFYQSTISGKGETLGKKLRSRYVERLFWEEEEQAGRLLPEKVTYIPLKIHPEAFRRHEYLPKGQAEKEAVERLLANRDPGISATLLNTYLTCPAKFYFQYLLGLSPAKEVAEFDAAELGEVVHSALEEYFRPFLGRLYLPHEDNDPDRLFALFREFFGLSSLYHRLGPERRFFIEETALFRLRNYLEFLRRFHPQGFRLVSLEKSFTKEWQGWRFFGRLDRLERRGETLYVLDYKTGMFVKSLGANHLEEKLFPYDPPLSFGAEELFDLRERLPDIQLFLYLFLTQEEGAQNAAFLQLAAGKIKDIEKPLFPEGGLLEEAQEFMTEKFPRFLEYLLRHMIEAEAFYATPEDKLCKFCDFRLCCECARY